MGATAAENSPQAGIYASRTTCRRRSRTAAPTERDAAAEWLVEYLAEAGKPVAPKVVIAAAQEAGFSRAPLYRAREGLEGEVVTLGALRSASSAWQLAKSSAGEGAEEAI